MLSMPRVREPFEMREPTRKVVYRFAEFELDPVSRDLRRDGLSIELPQKCVGVLSYLVNYRGRLVSRDELRRALWPDVRVDEGSLTQAIWLLRRALCDHERSPRLIETGRGRGYRFNAVVETRDAAAEPPTAEESRSALRAALAHRGRLPALETIELVRLVERLCGGALPPALRARAGTLSREALLTALEMALLLHEDGNGQPSGDELE